MNLTMNGQSQLEKGDLAAAQRSLDAVIKADPTFYPAYYIRAEVFLNQRKYQEAIQDCNEALRKDSTFAEAALLRARANYYLSRYGESLKEIDHVINIRPRRDALARAYSERAWLRLNCPDQSNRNGPTGTHGRDRSLQAHGLEGREHDRDIGDGVCRSRRLRLRGALRGESLSPQKRGG